MVVRIRTAYEPSEDEGINFEGQISLTHQSYKEECDVNHIIKVHNGEIPQAAAEAFGMFYEDCTSPYDFQESLNIVIRANEVFADMPSDIRDRFSNDPIKFLDFVHNDANKEEMRKMGLLKPDAAPSQVDGEGAAVPGTT